MYLLDANVVSELRKAGSGRADQNVLAWFADKRIEDMHLSVLTILEIEEGVLQKERKDKQQGALLRR